MNGNAVIEILFDNYLKKNTSTPLEESREAAYSKLDSLIEDNAEAGTALIEFQYEAMRAAFYEGFSTAVELFTGKSPIMCEK